MTLRPLLIAGLCLLLAGCNQLTAENYDKLRPGMKRAEVERLLGAPTECKGALGLSSCNWGDSKRYISIQFAGDEVMLFSGSGLR